MEDIEDMFLSGVPAWKTRVEYGDVRRKEGGAVDKEMGFADGSPERREGEVGKV